MDFLQMNNNTPNNLNWAAISIIVALFVVICILTAGLLIFHNDFSSAHYYLNRNSTLLEEQGIQLEKQSIQLEKQNIKLELQVENISQIADFFRGEPFASSYIKLRKGRIINHLMNAQEDHVLLLGDSVSEVMPLYSFGGYPVINAGIGWAKIDEVLSILEKTKKDRLLEHTKGVIIFIGFNNASFHRTEIQKSPINFKRTLEQIILLLNESESKDLTLVTLFRPEDNKQLGSDYFDINLIEEYNKIFREVASINSITVIELEGIENLENYTMDGIHPNKIGYDFIIKQILKNSKKT